MDVNNLANKTKQKNHEGKQVIYPRSSHTPYRDLYHTPLDLETSLDFSNQNLF